MLSVVVPTRNSEEGLARTLASLVSAAAEGVVREVVVVDDGSTDGTRIVADAAGCTLVDGSGAWASRISLGIAAARRAPWFLLLAPDVFLDAEWFREASAFVDRIERSGRADRAVATFRWALDDFGWHARLAEHVVAMAEGLLAAPLGEQGLLISRAHWLRLAAAMPPDAGRGAVFAGLPRRAVHVLRADAVVLTPRDGETATPSLGRLARIALAGLGLPPPPDDERA
ncbi:MAG: glycosyltransferase [Siculibacillus sp.]